MHRLEETKAAIKIQCVWRGYLVRYELAKLTAAALVIQSCWRMYQGSLEAEEMRVVKDRELRMKYFNQAATVIQVRVNCSPLLLSLVSVCDLT